MCVFCGGGCGGDALFTSAGLGIVLVALRIQLWRASYKARKPEGTNSAEVNDELDPEQSRTD